MGHHSGYVVHSDGKHVLALAKEVDGIVPHQLDELHSDKAVGEDSGSIHDVVVGKENEHKEDEHRDGASCQLDAETSFFLLSARRVIGHQVAEGLVAFFRGHIGDARRIVDILTAEFWSPWNAGGIFGHEVAEISHCFFKFFLLL